MYVYLFQDESGDTGSPDVLGTSADFSLCICVAYSENIEHLSKQISNIVATINKPEIKFSKLSQNERTFVDEKLRLLDIEYVSLYIKKDEYLNKENLLKYSFGKVLEKFSHLKLNKIKIYIDGDDNAYLRRLYQNILSMHFDKSVLKFGDSRKEVLLQVADFYAGKSRSCKMDLIKK